MTGIVLLVLVSILIFLGLAHRVLDKLYLSDRGGLLFIVALIIGSFVDIPVWRHPTVMVNVGGFILPLFLALYVLFRAGSGKEWTRSLIGIVITIAVLFGVNKIYRFDPRHGWIEPQYLWAIISGIIAYVAGRSRRLAFIISVLGIIAMDIVNLFEVGTARLATTVRLGGAGAFDTLIIAAVLAVLLAEIIGESREALQGGPAHEDRPDELQEALDHPPQNNKHEGGEES